MVAAMRFLAAALLCFFAACGHAPAPEAPAAAAAPEGRAAGAAPVQRTLIAALRHGPPQEPFVDLGPILMSEVHDRAELTQRLQLEADRLHADGFILESEGLYDTYRVPIATARPEALSIAFAVAAALASEAPLAPSAERNPYYWVRAYRLGAQPSLQLELHALHRALLAGELEPGEYAARRLRLLREAELGSGA